MKTNRTEPRTEAGEEQSGYAAVNSMAKLFGNKDVHPPLNKSPRVMSKTFYVPEQRMILKDYLQLQYIKNTKKSQKKSSIRRIKTLEENLSVSLDNKIIDGETKQLREKSELQLVRYEAEEQLRRCVENLQQLIIEIQALKCTDQNELQQSQEIALYCEIYRKAKQSISPVITQVAQLINNDKKNKAQRMAAKILSYSTTQLSKSYKSKKDMKNSKNNSKRIINNLKKLS